MSRAGLKHQKDYLTDFSPEAYLTTTTGEATTVGSLREFFFKGYNDIFKTGKVTGRRLMDIGTGPFPLSVISAVPYVQEIYLSDYTPANRDYLYQWLTGSSSQDFKDLFSFYTNLEAKGETWKSRSEELKTKVGAILPVDLTDDKIFGDVLFHQFDIITSSLCFESVAKETKDWGTYAEKLSKFLEKGGHLVINGVLGCTFYYAGDQKFHSSPITKNELKANIQNAGYMIQSFSECDGPPKAENNVSDYEFGFVMHCIKK